MNQFARQSSQSADIQTLPDDLAEELTRLPGEVISVSDAPSLAPPVPLSQDEVRTIVLSLMLTMFLAALARGHHVGDHGLHDRHDAAAAEPLQAARQDQHRHAGRDRA